MKRKGLLLFFTVLLVAISMVFSSCGAQPKGVYVSDDPYLRLNITDAENIIDFDGEMNLNGDNSDIIFSISKDSRHFEIKQDNSVIFEGYYETDKDGEILRLKTNETEFELARVNE